MKVFFGNGKTIMGKTLLIAVALFSAATAAMAHKVKCFAAADGAKVAGYAWMSGGARPKGVPFKVMDPSGAVLLEGKTDGKGEFSFVPPKRCDLTIIVYAGPGHEGKFTIRADELPDADAENASADSAEKGARAEPASSKPAAAPSPANPSPVPAISVSGKNIGELVERAVSEQIAPLRAELAEFEDRETFRDVFAGLGYIAGIAGAAFFFLGTKRKNARKEERGR